MLLREDHIADYYHVEKWDGAVLRKEIEHDFGRLNRKAIILHYGHTSKENCTDRCELMENQNYAPKVEETSNE